MSVIAAISTPPAAGGIAVIRISGEEAIELAAKIFQPFGDKSVEKMPGHTCAYGRVVSTAGEVLDDALLTVFRSPKSYTGEDTAEISCHGGIYVSRRILREVISLGAEPAGAGEFTKRAFLNGKLTLTQAEAVADIISAEGRNALQSANLMREGELFRRIKGVTDEIVGLLASLAAWTDYPDEDISETDNGSMQNLLEGSISTLERLLADYDSGRVFREGIDCVIAGRPNVGKSTLMNSLLGYERSIVTSVAGTTRDVVEETLRLGDVILRISDTAGLRDASDEVEQIGVRLANAAFERAELVLLVLDGAEELSDYDRELLQKLRGRKHIVIINKSDLPQKIDKQYIQSEIILEVSAKLRNGLDALRDEVYRLFGLNSCASTPTLFANERQKLCCERALGRLREAYEALTVGETLDAVTVCLDSAADALLELTGEKATEAVVEQVFERFCVGK